MARGLLSRLAAAAGGRARAGAGGRRGLAGGAGVGAAAVRALRAETGAPIGEVKAALEAAGGSRAGALEELRRRGLAAAQKKQGRAAREGAVAAVRGGAGGALAEVNSETDFAARDARFQALALAAARAVLAAGAGGELSPAALRALPLAGDGADAAALGGGETVGDAEAWVGGQLREKVAVRRAEAVVSGPGGVVGVYTHAPLAPGVGAQGALVALEGGGGGDEADRVARQLAMHVAAAAPAHLAEVPPEALEAECALLEEAALAQGKPAKIVPKVVEGQLRKWVRSQCLAQQPFVMDEDRSVAEVAEAQGLTLAGFARMKCGEGLAETAAPDFAAEVAKTLEGQT